jgi:hypothetical protein
MKRKNSPHSISSETRSPLPTREAIDYRKTSDVARGSFLSKMGIAGASLAAVLALMVASSTMADDTFLKFRGGIGVIPVSSVGPTGFLLVYSPRPYLPLRQTTSFISVLNGYLTEHADPDQIDAPP